MGNTDKFEGSLNSKGKKKRKKREIIVRTVQEGITKSDGVKLSKRKFKLNLRKKSLLKYIRLLSDCPWGAVQTAACRLFSLGKMFSGMQPRKLQKQETEVYTFISAFTVSCVLFTGTIRLNLEQESGCDYSALLKLVGVRCVNI